MSRCMLVLEFGGLLTSLVQQSCTADGFSGQRLPQITLQPACSELSAAAAAALLSVPK